MIEKLRKSKSMTQEELAKAVGVSRSTVTMWETGKSVPRPAILKELAAMFGCTIDELLA